LVAEAIETRSRENTAISHYETALVFDSVPPAEPTGWLQESRQAPSPVRERQMNRVIRKVRGWACRHAKALACVAIIAACVSSAGPSWAEYPDRPIRIVVAYPPGGTGDLVARVVADGLRSSLGASVVVENQSGASGSIATAAVARAKPDGYTILLAGNALFAILPHVRKVAYDPVKDFTPIANISEAMRVLAVNNSVPVKTFAEFIAYAKKNPGKLNFGSAGIGSTLHVMTESFRNAVGIDAVHVPYRGSAPATQALLAGNIQFLIDTGAIPHVQQGALRGLAAVNDKRLPALPDLPTLAELGYPNIRTSGWQALIGPAGVPPEVVSILNKHLVELYKDPKFVARLAKIGVTPRYRGSAELAKDLREDYEYFGKVLKQLNLKTQ
jgi:tripartite-type tricarboxylate transporter receptor subunit TctC